MAFVERSLANDLSIVNVGPLALLRPLLEQLNVTACIDRHLPTDAEFSHGSVLAILLAARLHSPTALVNVADWAREHGVEYLWNIPAHKLNDDRLGRALDAFFEHRHAILADITHEVLRLSELSLQQCHFDVTHLVLYGTYEDSQPRAPARLEQLLTDLRDAPAHISRGYLTKYKMLQLGITAVTDDLGPVPVACHLFDGNRNGHTGIKEQYQLLRDSLDLPDGFLLVSDRGTCSAEHVGRLLRHGHHALCAGPWQDYGPVYEQHADQLVWQQASYLSREQQRRRVTGSTLPLEDYRLAERSHELIDPQTRLPFACRLIFVHSSAAAKEARQRREKNVARIRAGLEAAARKLERAHAATTPQSLTRQLTRLLGQKAAAQHFRWHLESLTEAEQAALPAPAKGHRRQTHRLVSACDEASLAADSRHDGIYVLVTTAPAQWSADALFTEYKRQTFVERAHHELKTPVAVTPVFLKTPRRVEALVSLLFVALQAAMTLERLYRRRVPSSAPLSERRMTAERLLRHFRVCGLMVEERAYGTVVSATRLSPTQRGILNRLSFPTPAKILKTILDPPPTS
jgi:transposase